MPEAENLSYEALSKNIDRSVRRENCKTLAAFTLGLALIVGGKLHDNSEQPKADALGFEFNQEHDQLPNEEQRQVGDYINGTVSAKNMDASIVKKAENLKDIKDRQTQSEQAGVLEMGIGSIVSFVSILKFLNNYLSGKLQKNDLKSTHPDFASDRINKRSKDIFQLGFTLEAVDQLKRVYQGNMGYFEDVNEYDREELQEIGLDFEKLGEFELNEDNLKRTLAQELTEIDAEEMKLFRIDLMDDLWVPKRTFTSIGSWYDYRKKDILMSKPDQRLEETDLHLPDLEPRSGGIGIAIGRICQYIRLFDIAEKANDRSEAWMKAMQGGIILDKVAPRKDETQWIDYLQNLSQQTFATTE